MKGTTILPCPFCGGLAKCDRRIQNSDDYSVACASGEICGGAAFITEFGFRTREGAIAAWNTRSGRLSPAGDVVGALLMVQHKLLRDNPYAPVEHEIKPTWFDIQEAVNAALHGQGDGWLPIETADALPRDGSHFNLIDMLNGGRPSVAVYFDSDFMECENGTWIEIESYTHWARIPPLPTPSGQPNLEGPDYEDGPEFEGWAERAGIDVATCKHDFGVDSRGDIVRCQICGTPRALIEQPNSAEQAVDCDCYCDCASLTKEALTNPCSFCGKPQPNGEEG
jgi:hypothetical protein